MRCPQIVEELRRTGSLLVLERRYNGVRSGTKPSKGAKSGKEASYVAETKGTVNMIVEDRDEALLTIARIKSTGDLAFEIPEKLNEAIEFLKPPKKAPTDEARVI
ncbi:hypothetical protein BS78_09G023000 [Paspalum vaginatum]|nr:hypothetical protein BS78_09G023000 [Paspalum vaginatum]